MSLNRDYMNSLTTSIEELYVAFSDVPAPRSIDACSHCFEDGELDVLLSGPLRALQADDLSSYASSALSTAGDVSDYLYFLPRILEISVSDDSWWPDIEVTGRVIGETDTNGWSKCHRDALLGLLNSVIGHLIAMKNYSQIDPWICAIARAGLDVRPFLELIETDAEAVFEYLTYNARKLDRGKLSNEFWERPNKGHDIIVDWLRSEKIMRIFREAAGYYP